MNAGRRSRRRWPWVLVALVLLLAGVAVGGVATVYPSVASTTCPRCYGLTQVRPGVYTEPGLSAAKRHRVVTGVDTAIARVRSFYGTRQSAPRVLACTSAGCYDRIGGGGELGVAILDRAVILSPRGVDTVIASHEMSHVELHQRLGGHADRVPQWFDEGLAVLVSGDPRYLRPATASDRCRVEPGGRLPASLDGWLRAASADKRTYARAACRVDRWVDRRGGRAAVLDLIRRLDQGERFSAIVKQ